MNPEIKNDKASKKESELLPKKRSAAGRPRGATPVKKEEPKKAKTAPI